METPGAVQALTGIGRSGQTSKDLPTIPESGQHFCSLFHPQCQLKSFWVLKPIPSPFPQTRLAIRSCNCTGHVGNPDSSPQPVVSLKCQQERQKKFTLSIAKATGVLRGQAEPLLRNPQRHPLSNMGCWLLSRRSHTNSSASGSSLTSGIIPAEEGVEAIFTLDRQCGCKKSASDSGLAANGFSPPPPLHSLWTGADLQILCGCATEQGLGCTSVA